jgi:hypothetical protein
MCEDLRRKKGGRIWPTAMFYPGHPSGYSPSFMKKFFLIGITIIVELYFREGRGEGGEGSGDEYKNT